MKKKNIFLKEISEKDIEKFNFLIDDYFNKYYANNRAIKNISYYNMEAFNGHSVILEYKNFRQYVNIYYDAYDYNTVNCCFEFKYNGRRFLCHFADVLNLIDSNDISFYTYDKCFNDEKIVAALDNIMSATRKYQTNLNSIALTYDLSEKLYMDLNSDAEDDDCLSLPDLVLDMDYVIYNTVYEIDELKKYLAKREKRNKLKKGYETRACRVLCALDRKEIKKVKKNKRKEQSYSKKDKALLYTPYIIFAIVFAVAFGFIGLYIDKQIYNNCFGRMHFDTVLGFAVVGAFLSCILTWIIHKPLYKRIVKKDYYDEFQQILMAESSPPALIAALGVLIVIVCLFFTAFFCFNGMAFNSDGNIIYKDTAFSQKKIIMFADTEIAIVKGYHSKGGYSEYLDTAYAFKIENDWYEYGVPDEEEVVEYIENSINKYNKDVKIYKSIEDIEQ